MTDATYANGDTVTFADGTIATFGDSSTAHVETNDRVFIPPIKTLSAGVKPTYPVEIDWDHPLANSIETVIIDGSKMASGESYVVVGSGIETAARGPNGQGVSSTGSGYAKFTGMPSDTLTEATVICDAYLDSLTANDIFFYCADAGESSLSEGLIMWFDTVGFETSNANCISFNLEDVRYETAANSINIGGMNTVVFSFYYTAASRIYEMHINGVTVLSDTFGANGVGVGHDLVRSSELLLNGYGGTLDNLDGCVYMSVIADKYVNPALGRSLSADPYQFLKSPTPQTQIITTAPTANDRVWIL